MGGTGLSGLSFALGPENRAGTPLTSDHGLRRTPPGGVSA
jgi:hypothetical protein